MEPHFLLLRDHAGSIICTRKVPVLSPWGFKGAVCKPNVLASDEPGFRPSGLAQSPPALSVSAFSLIVEMLEQKSLETQS